MPLIKCVDCKKKISSSAEKCPFCGCPVSVVKDNTPSDKLKKSLEPSRGLQFALIKGRYFVTGLGSCEDTDVVIPSEHDCKKVVAIADNAFRFAEITSVYIPKSIVRIGYCAFEGCHELKKIIYEGSKASWGCIRRDEYWCYNSSFDLVCKNATLHF
ncbi:MAG: leucine-rich repeat protein [Clostridia bacterium]|nr:leucine-rich repeat protein [Clostridia bacterium]